MKEYEEIYVIYLRKSRSDNPSESTEEVLSRHENQLQELAVKLTGATIDESNIYREIISGGEDIENRPAFMQVLKRMEQGDVKGVLVIDTKRLSRSGLYGAGDVLNAFEFTNTLICTPTKTYNLKDKYDKKFLEMEMIQSSDYLEYTKEILNRGRMYNLQNGYYIGGEPPYGYDKIRLKKEKGFKLIPHKEEADIVKMMFDLYVEELGTVSLTNYLNKLGLKTRRGNNWTPNAVYKILSNPVYHGDILWARRTTIKTLENGKIVKKLVTNKEPTLVKGQHEPLVSDEIFQLVQAKLKSHPSSKVTRNLELRNSIAGIVYCGCCGKAMVRKSQNGAAKIRHKRVQEITPKDKEKISFLIRQHKRIKKMSLTDIANALELTKGKIDSWFSGNLDRVYFSKEFSSYWFKIKELLEIETTEYDDMITVYKDIRDKEHLVCPTLNCSNVASPLERVENSILNTLETHLSDYKYFLDNYEEEIIKDARNNEKTLNMIDNKIEKLKKEKKNALRNYNAEDMDREEYLELKAEIEEELKMLEEQRQKIETNKENDKVTKYKKAIPILENCLSEYHNLTIAERNELLKSIIEKVIYTKSEKERWKRESNFDLEIFLRI